MKKIYTFLMLSFLISMANAQNFTGIWRKTAQAGASDLPWFNNTGSSVRSLTYSSTTNKLYVALTSGTATGDSIFIFNAATGAVEGKLRRDGAAIGNEPFKNLRIRVDNSGVIYSSSLSVADVSNANLQRCRIYRWASEADTATLASSFVTSERCGDALGIIGTGVNTKIFVAGTAYARDYVGVNDSTAQKIYILTTVDGLVFTKTDSIRLISTKTTGAQAWIKSLDPIGNNITDGFWVNNVGRPVNRLDVVGTPGAYTASIGFSVPIGNGNGQASNAYGSVKYLRTSGNKKYIGMAGAWFSGITPTTNTSVVMRMVDVTNEAALVTAGTDTLRGVNNTDTLLRNSNNTTASGDVDYKNNGDGSYDVFYVSTNNGIACTRSSTSLPVELTNFSVMLSRNTVALTWSTANEINNAGFEVEKSTNGVSFAKIGFVKANGSTANNYEFVDNNATKSKAASIFYRLKQMDKDGKFNYSSVRAVKLPTTQLFSISTLNNPVKDEIKLVVNAAIQNDVTIFVTNNSGQQVYTKKISVQQGVNNVVIPANQLLGGMYFVTLQTAIDKQTISIMKD